MLLPDVNVLVYAHRKDAADHPRFRAWLEAVVGSAEPYAISELVLSAFVRVVTNPRIFHTPTPLPRAIAFCTTLREQPNAVIVHPGERHWSIFIDLCERTALRGDLVAGAYLAALAIESRCEWVTTDRDYARFPGLRWKTPDL